MCGRELQWTYPCPPGPSVPLDSLGPALRSPAQRPQLCAPIPFWELPSNPTLSVPPSSMHTQASVMRWLLLFFNCLIQLGFYKSNRIIHLSQLLGGIGKGSNPATVCKTFWSEGRMLFLYQIEIFFVYIRVCVHRDNPYACIHTHTHTQELLKGNEAKIIKRNFMEYSHYPEVKGLLDIWTHFQNKTEYVHVREAWSF